MRSIEATTTAALPHSRLWASYVRATMDQDHRLVLRWCAHLDFDDVLRIDHGSIHAALNDPARSLGKWRIVFGSGRLPLTIVPGGLVKATESHMLERSSACGIVARHNEPVFEESYGEPITRASLCDSIRRALTLVRLSDAFLAGEASTR